MPKNVTTLLLLAGAALPFVAAAEADAATVPRPSRPDLAVTKVAKVTPASVALGGALTVRDTTANTGRGTAPASATRFYLTADVKASLKARATSKADPRASDTDVLLSGARARASIASWPAPTTARRSPRRGRATTARRRRGR